MRNSILFLATSFFLLANAAKGSDNHVTVRLEVSAESQGSQITSYLSRELRRLGDVDMVERSPQFVISVVTTDLNMQNGRPLGTAISVVVEFKQTELAEFFKALSQTDNAIDASIVNTVKDASQIVRHEIRLAGKDDLDDVCRKIIASIDGDTFEMHRKMKRIVDPLVKQFAPVK